MLLLLSSRFTGTGTKTVPAADSRLKADRGLVSASLPCDDDDIRLSMLKDEKADEPPAAALGRPGEAAVNALPGCCCGDNGDGRNGLPGVVAALRE